MEFPRAVILELASLPWRLGHLIWHAIREEWNSMSPEEQARFTADFPEWQPPRPSLTRTRRAIIGTGAGIDFLFMHRHMIQWVNQRLQMHGQPRIIGWPAPPPPDDPVYRVIHDPRLPISQYPSRDDQVWTAYIAQYQQLMDPASLQVMSLDELGTRLEYGIHAAMHQRFGVYPSNGRGLRKPYWSGPNPQPSKQWLDPGYDTLLDPWSAHVHPWFWKLHALLDTCIDQWEAARQHRYSGPPPWMGGMDHDHQHPHAHPHAHPDPHGPNAMPRAREQWHKFTAWLPRLARGGMFTPRPIADPF